MTPLEQGFVTSEYSIAFRSVSRAKNLCLFAILLAMLLQLAAFCLVRFVGVLDAAEKRAPAPSVRKQVDSKPKATTRPAVAKQPATRDTSAVTAAVPDGNDNAAVGTAHMWRAILSASLHAIKVLSPIVALLLTLMTLLAVKFSLVGRLGGAAGLVGALLWSMLVLVLVSPWQNILLHRFACGATYTLDELVRQTRQIHAVWGAAGVGTLPLVLYYVRFVGLPVVTILVWISVVVRFSMGRSQMSFPVPITAVTPAPGADEPFQDSAEV